MSFFTYLFRSVPRRTVPQPNLRKLPRGEELTKENYEPSNKKIGEEEKFC